MLDLSWQVLKKKTIMLARSLTELQVERNRLTK